MLCILVLAGWLLFELPGHARASMASSLYPPPIPPRSSFGPGFPGHLVDELLLAHSKCAALCDLDLRPPTSRLPSPLQGLRFAAGSLQTSKPGQPPQGPTCRLKAQRSVMQKWIHQMVVGFQQISGGVVDSLANKLSLHTSPSR